MDMAGWLRRIVLHCTGNGLRIPVELSRIKFGWQSDMSFSLRMLDRRRHEQFSIAYIKLNCPSLIFLTCKLCCFQFDVTVVLKKFWFLLPFKRHFVWFQGGVKWLAMRWVRDLVLAWCASKAQFSEKFRGRLSFFICELVTFHQIIWLDSLECSICIC